MNKQEPIHTPSILSTRQLTERQRNRLLRMGVTVQDYNAIEIHFRKVSLPPGYTHLIFSSQNGVRSFLEARGSAYAASKALCCFCVGEKTRRLLETNGFYVASSARSARLLARRIIGSESQNRFLFPCGNLRRDTLPSQLKEAGIALEEVIVYDTLPNPQKFEKTFDAILFYSPSGVRSFFTINDAGTAISLCIGPTTAEEVKKYTDRFMCADEPSISSVISLVSRLPGLTAPEKKSNHE